MKNLKKISICLLVLSFVLTLTGCGNKHNKSYVDDNAKYTYRTATDSLPTSWNNHTYQSNDATTILDYTEDALYVFDYNETKDGYQIVPSMANAMPKDVTKEYVGKYGITEDSEHQVYEIELKTWLKYDNGDPITAEDFIKSAQLLMNPKAANYRADNFYNGDLRVYGAEEYVKQGTYSLSEFVSAAFGDDEYVDPTTFTATEDGHLQVNGADVVIDLTSGGNWGSNGLSDYAGAGYLDNNQADWALLEGAADENGQVKLTAETLKAVQNCIAALQGYADVEAYAATRGDYAYQEFEEMAFLGKVWPEYSWDEVGYFAKDDHTLVLALTKPLDGFYLNYSLGSNMNLVHVPTYESCQSDNGGVYSNSYATSVETYVGYGPYKLTTYIDSSEVLMERNTYWHGYYEEEHKGQYQATALSVKQVSEAATRLEMFLKGELDSYGLQAKDMDTYQGSDFTYYTEGDSTWFIAFNPDEEGLLNAEKTATPVTAGNTVVKRILCLKDFRKALSFSVDRAAYELALDPTGSPAKALYGNMIISDPDKGTAYRTTEQAKQVVVDFWGLTDEIGEGKEYATIDEAIESITGYDLEGAKQLFNAAYDEAVAAKYIPSGDNWEIQIIIGQPGSGSSAYYNNGYQLLKKVWTEAVEGTKLEGHIVFTQSQPLGSTNFADYLKNNTIDLLFGVGWTGSALNPYSLIQAYVDPNYQYDPAWDTSSELLEVTINGEKLSAPVYDWYLALSGETITANVVDGTGTKDVTAGTTAENELRLDILAAMEGAVLQQYDMIPVGLKATASLRGMRVKYYTEEYVYGMGRGGVQYYTFAMNDDEWSNYVKEQGGTLDYK
ncbi:MAG: ABC transporter substrate-binding protein [Erysipelotrichia bacterium]|nr:ABC transporter substrate-binding protein [Erysipelotrichia bacterium]